MTCPDSSTEGVASGVTSAPVTWSPQPTASDVKDGPITTITCTDESGTTVTSDGSYAVGVTTVTCRANDTEGNSGECQFSITLGL